MPTPREMMAAAERRRQQGATGDHEPVENDARERENEPAANARRSSRPAGSRQGASRQASAREGDRRRDAAHAGERGANRSAGRGAERTRDEQRQRAQRSQQGSRQPDGQGAHASSGGSRNRSAGSNRMRNQITQWRMYGVAAFAVIMVLGGVIGLLFFARPTTSAVEMRNLTEYPEFTVQSFLDGSYFTQVSLWYADTYPLREPMVAADHAVDSLFGVNTGTGMVGGNVQADEIPVEEEHAEPVYVEPPAEAPDERVVAEDIQANIMSGIYVQNGAGYAIYYFSQNAADTYIAAMNKAAETLDGVATVYSIMAPANSITLSDQEALAVGGSDQQQTLDYLRTRFNDKVKAVEIVDDIIAHRGEYLYFNTDHHWTQLGAYYAYVAFCEEKGVTPKPYTAWRMVDLGEFQGTYYDTIAAMGGVVADEIVAYVPNDTNEMTYWTSYGDEVNGHVIDESAVDWEPSYKYSAFIAGDQPLEIIHNPKVTDGSSCLVVKDSYGCAFVPNLVDDYETIHVIDFRETNENLCDYVKENGIKDVIFLTGMKIGLTDSVAQTLLSEVS